MVYVDVILPLAFGDCLTYAIEEIDEKSLIGARVLVPLGATSKQIGIVLRYNPQPNIAMARIKKIIDVIDEKPIVHPTQLDLWQWISNYYLCPLGEVMNAALIAPILNNSFQQKTKTFVFIGRMIKQIDDFNVLKKYPRQHDLMLFLLAYLKEYNVDKIEKKELLQLANQTEAILQRLINKKFIYTEKCPISRLKTSQQSLIAPFSLSMEQQAALEQIKENFSQNKITLLKGVTASGKTEIYVHLIADTLKSWKSVLYLVPEIALTTQLTERLQRFFGEKVMIYHSQINEMERAEIYFRLRFSEESCLLIGSRSAIFLPFHRLGLVIVDEEQDQSYKQMEPAPRYNAKHVAIMMGVKMGASVLLGSATPSVETYHLCQQGKYGLVELKTQFFPKNPLQVEVLDMKKKYRKNKVGHISRRLIEAIEEELNHSRQVILFQNRRGYAHSIACTVCDYIAKCENCDVPLTYHKQTDNLVCHYCGKIERKMNNCPRCGAPLHSVGVGTEKVEEEIKKIFPQHNVERIDLDTTQAKDAFKSKISRFERREIDILVGTKMISKGIDFSNVSLVGIVNVDNLFVFPDFRSIEYAFHQLKQIAGRAGRKMTDGKLLIQTFTPEHPLFDFIGKIDDNEFYNEQIAERRLFHYPPFYRIIKIYLKHNNADQLSEISTIFCNTMKSIFNHRCTDIIAPFISKINNLYINFILLKFANNEDVSKAKKIIAAQMEAIKKRYSRLFIFADVDPL